MSESTRIDAIRVMDRHRKDFGDIEALAASIKDVGLLQPVVITPDLRLVAGERRLRAAVLLGHDTIPARIVSHLDDGAARLRAERDENTCREPMTPEELVNLGLELERLERPKAAARQAEGGRAGAESRWGDGSVSGETKPSEPTPTRTNDLVADALGTSRPTYARAKHVVQTARGDNDPTPQVQEAAQEALKEMNEGTTTITGAYNKVREARGSKPPADRLTRPQPPKYGGNRKKHAAVIESISVSLSGLAMAADGIGDFDPTVTAEEAARLADDLSTSIRSLNRLKQNLYRKATP